MLQQLMITITRSIHAKMDSNVMQAQSMMKAPDPVQLTSIVRLVLQRHAPQVPTQK